MLEKDPEVRLADLIHKALKAKLIPAAFDNGEANKSGFRSSVVTCTYAGQAFVISIQPQEGTAYAEDSIYTRALRKRVEVRQQLDAVKAQTQ